MGKQKDIHNGDKVIKAMSERAKAAAELVGLFVAGEAALLCPVDSGELRNSIQNQVNTEEQSAVIGTNVEYALFIEKGTGIYALDGDGRQTPWSYKDPKTGEWVTTRGHRAQPFLTPAAEENGARIRDIVEKELSKLDGKDG